MLWLWIVWPLIPPCLMPIQAWHQVVLGVALTSMSLRTLLNRMVILCIVHNCPCCKRPTVFVCAVHKLAVKLWHMCAKTNLASVVEADLGSIASTSKCWVWLRSNCKYLRASLTKCQSSSSQSLNEIYIYIYIVMHWCRFYVDCHIQW